MNHWFLYDLQISFSHILHNVINSDIDVWWTTRYGDRPVLDARPVVRSCGWLRGCPPSTGKDRSITTPFAVANCFPFCSSRCSPFDLIIDIVLQLAPFTVSPTQTFLSLCLLDISSHWCQMYSTSSLGKHHKSEDGNEGRNFLVRWFYKYYFFFGYLCVGAEFTYVLAYVLQFTADQWIHPILKMTLWAVAPGCFLKQLVNVMQLTSACYAVAEHDAKLKNEWSIKEFPGH